jgi:hypothetical protein
MKRDKSWFDRVTEVQEKLSVLPDDFPVDRELMQSLFGVSARTGLRILEFFGARTDSSGRLTLEVAALRAGLAAPDLEAALRQRAAVQQGKQDLLAVKRRFGLRRPDPAFPRVEDRPKWKLQDLPQAIQIAPGRLMIEFADIPDLLWQLEVLVSTLSDDREEAEKRLEPAPAVSR